MSTYETGVDFIDRNLHFPAHAEVEMSWHYRVLRHPEGYYALHEVYCDENGRPNGYTADPTTFISDDEEGVEGVAESLRMALNDALKRPVLDAANFPEPFRLETAGKAASEAS